MRCFIPVDDTPKLKKKIIELLSQYMDDEMRRKIVIDKEFYKQIEDNLLEYLGNLFGAEKKNKDWAKEVQEKLKRIENFNEEQTKASIKQKTKEGIEKARAQLESEAAISMSEQGNHN